MPTFGKISSYHSLKIVVAYPFFSEILVLAVLFRLHYNTITFVNETLPFVIEPSLLQSDILQLYIFVFCCFFHHFSAEILFLVALVYKCNYIYFEVQ